MSYSCVSWHPCRQPPQLAHEPHTALDALMYLKIAVIGVVPLGLVLVRLIDDIEEPERTAETVVHYAIARELRHRRLSVALDTMPLLILPDELAEIKRVDKD